MAYSADPLTKNHLLVFGAIIQQFAHFERLIEIVINSALGARQYGVTAIALSGLSYSAKCDVLKSLLKIVNFPNDHNEIIKTHVGNFNAYSRLRNDIAHHTWIPGDRPGSIKPLSVSARGGKAEVRGVHDDERDYKLDELDEIARTLIRIHNELRDFLEKVGAIPNIAENIDTTNPGSKTSPEAPS
jgi:hypothetical protein